MPLKKAFYFRRFGVVPETTFEELYFHINEYIITNGYKNLDFMGNLGHSIVTQKNDRIYIEKGNKAPIGSVKYFTFEPHISLIGSKYALKKRIFIILINLY